MWTISEVKELGKRAFKANYWYCVLAAFLMSLFAGSRFTASNSQAQNTDLQNQFNSMTPEQQRAVAAALLGGAAVALLIGLAIKIFLANPVNVGGCAFFTSNAENAPAPFGLMKTGFQNYGHTFMTLLLRDVYLMLWCLLLLIPGIIKAYSYRMVPYILADNPDMPANEVITRSREMMDGNKWQAFVLDLSFLGWVLLGILTLGLGLLFWSAPYMQSTYAALYLKLRDAA